MESLADRDGWIIATRGPISSPSGCERAICYFEALSGLTVTVHDLTHSLWPYVPVSRFQHSSARCRAVKTGPHGSRCVRFEVDEFRKTATQWRDGRAHRCHAGFVELAQPVFDHGRLILVLFAGQADVSAIGALDLVAESSPVGAAADHHGLVGLDDSSIERFREGLRQLGARLRCAIIDLNLDMQKNDLPRAILVRRFVADHYHEPIDLEGLAAYLRLSPDRARHVVVETCGMSFSRLVRRVRIEAAQALLLNTTIPVAEVAHRCGFSDPGAFSRAFRNDVGMSPLSWRKTRQA